MKKKLIFIVLILLLLFFIWYFLYIFIPEKKDKKLLMLLRHYDGRILLSFFTGKEISDKELEKSSETVDVKYIALWEELDNCHYDEKKFQFLKENFFEISGKLSMDSGDYFNRVKNIYQICIVFKIKIIEGNEEEIIKLAENLDFSLYQGGAIKYPILIRSIVSILFKKNFLKDDKPFINNIKDQNAKILIEIMEYLNSKEIDKAKAKLEEIKDLKFEKVFLEEIRKFLLCLLVDNDFYCDNCYLKKMYSYYEKGRKSQAEKGAQKGVNFIF